MTGGKCWNCGANLTALDYGRQDTCRQCGRSTRACKSCVNYDRGSYNECREPQADRVVDKETGNFCDFFKPGGAGGSAQSRETLKAAAEALFKKNS